MDSTCGQFQLFQGSLTWWILLDTVDRQGSFRVQRRYLDGLDRWLGLPVSFLGFCSAVLAEVRTFGHILAGQRRIGANEMKRRWTRITRDHLAVEFSARVAMVVVDDVIIGFVRFTGR